MAQSLPKSDGTTSTNYGPQFEISSTAIFVLRCCKQNKSFTVWVNYTEYEPWDDIVAKIDDRIVCVQLKHNEKLDKDKLNVCLNKRISLLEKHSSQRDSIIFVYFATTPDDGIRTNTSYSATTSPPCLINLLLTNNGNVYFERDNANGETFFCMNQHNVANESADVKQALAEYIGPHYLTEDHLKDIQTKFLDYLRKRYLRLYKGSDPITDIEIRKLLAYTILNKFKVEYKPSNSKVKVTSNLEEIMESQSVVVVNHRWSSAFRDNIWWHLMAYLDKKISRKDLKQANLDELWMKGKLHMPIASPSKDTDKIILRALEIGGFEPKVLILRPRIFTIREGQDIITLLQNLNVTDNILEAKTEEDTEKYRFADVDLNNIIQNKHLKLHQEAFAKIAKEYCKGLQFYLKSFIEAHDEYNYVNDCNSFGNETLSAICATIRIKQIDVKVIQHLIKLGADINASMFGGYRPIYYAMDENRSDLVELLLQNEADPDPADKDGMRPLFYACMQNKTEIADLLIKYNSDRNFADVNGVRPLFMAYDKRNFDIMRLLLKNFDKAAAANTLGSHILHKAAEDGSVECLNCILECCANIKIFMTGDVNGKTPLDIARENGSPEFADILQRALEY